MNLPTATLTILAGLLAVCTSIQSPALTFEQRWEPVKQLPPMIDKSPRELTFEERWAPVRQLPQMLPGKADRDETPPQGVVRVFRVTKQVEGMIPGAAPILPTHAFVKTEMAAAEPVPVRVDAPTPPERPKVRTIRKASLDICTRHGMHKEITRGGKSWRCRK